MYFELLLQGGARNLFLTYFWAILIFLGIWGVWEGTQILASPLPQSRDSGL